MIVLKTPAALQKWRAKRRGLVGLVPTMGALHDGHASLIRRAARECGTVIVSIFVNPTQFGPNEDYSRYPRTFEADKRVCREYGAHAVYYPEASAMYPEGFATAVSVSGLSAILEGAVRPGHFDGVATVVLKLLNAAQPDRAYFGEKDYQQLQVVKTMVRDLDLPVKIVGCPTVREKDGLAMSSRNRYLSAEERMRAAALNRALKTGDPERARRMLTGYEIDYVVLVDADTLKEAGASTKRKRILGAIRLGKTRLIDNMSA